jgi:MscS family membrane protein
VERWAAAYLPSVLLHRGPFELQLWQWLSLPLIILFAWGVGTGVSRLAWRLLHRATLHTNTAWDDVVIHRIRGPLTLLCTLAGAAILVPVIGLKPQPFQGMMRVIHVGFILTLFWSLWRGIEVARQIVVQTRWAVDSAASRSLIPLGVRSGKILVLVFAIVAALSTMGFPVTRVIAGLGIGGLAVALAAQKTVENLFGAFSLGVDQPFREGDFVKIEEFVGTVETIGLRSTRIRTLDRTIITMPNGKLADMRLESFAVRDRLRLATVVSLTYDTTPSQMRGILPQLEHVLRTHPKIWPDAVVVKFREFAVSSLDIEIMAWFQTPDWGEFQGIRQEILLQFMDVVERAGASFALPTRTVHLAAPETMS